MTEGGVSAIKRRKGLFISFEGTEGSGKTTQMSTLVEHLRSLGYNVIENQEPGGTSIGRQIRRVLLDPENREMAPMTELLLMFASRAQAAAEVIVPALQSGKVVVSDRFTDSSLAYQGAARGMGFEKVLAAHELAVGSLLPDLTLWIEVDVEEGLARAQSTESRNASKEEPSEARIDQQPADFHRKVRDGYARIAAAEPQRFRVIDGDADPSTVAGRIWREVEPLLARIAKPRSDTINPTISMAGFENFSGNENVAKTLAAMIEQGKDPADNPAERPGGLRQSYLGPQVCSSIVGRRAPDRTRRPEPSREPGRYRTARKVDLRQTRRRSATLFESSGFRHFCSRWTPPAAHHSANAPLARARPVQTPERVAPRLSN